MLEELSIKNYALIEDLVLTFDAGLNILSGETGAGKSIIVGALGLILGAKADSSSIRAGSTELQVSCVIKIPDTSEAIPWLKKHFIEPEDGRIIIRRILRHTGRGSIFIQSVPSSRKDLLELTSYIFDMHGQHSHQSLLSLENQRKLLDRYAVIEEDVIEFKNNFAKLLEMKTNLSSMISSESKMIRERELLIHSCDEIEKANLYLGEEEILTKERAILLQHEKLLDFFDVCRNSLSENTGGALLLLRTARSAMDNLSLALEQLKPMASRLDNAFFEIEDVYQSIRQFQDTINFAPSRLEECEDRLHLIHKLQKKYGTTISDIQNYKEEANKKIAIMEASENARAEIEKGISILERIVLSGAGEISKKRIKSGKTLQLEIKSNLIHMGMPKAIFRIDVSPRETNNGKPSCGSNGLDSIEFLISPNEGEPIRPLKNIASGGELSRVMLSIKSVLADSDSVLSLIFDEIDAGIGGEIALSVGEHLSEIAKHRQVLCITHLASIAVHADKHIKVEKYVVGGRTFTGIENIDYSDRVTEIARMLSGDSSGIASLEHARELLKKYGH